MADVILPACTNFERDDLGEFAACGGYTTNSHSGNNYRVSCARRSASSRSGSRAPTTRSSRPSPSVSASTTSSPTAARPSSTGARRSTPAPTSPRRSTGRVRREGLPHHQRAGGLQAHAVPALVRRGPRLRHARQEQPQAQVPGKEHELGTYSGKIEFASESLKAYDPDDEERPVSPAVHRELGGSPHHRAVREVPAGAHVAAPALLVPLPLRQAHRLARRHPRAPHQEGRVRVVAGAAPPRGRRRARHPQRRHRAAVQRPRRRCSAARSSPSASSPASCTATRRRPSTTRSSPASPIRIDKGGCVNLLTSSRMLSKHAPGMTPNSCLIEVEKWEG